MSYINSSGAYPYTKYMLKADNPDVSFPADMNDAVLARFGVYPVVDTPMPTGDVVTEGVPLLIDGVYTQQWESRSFTAEEVAENLDEFRNTAIVSMKQARLALAQVGLLSSVDAALSALPEPDKTTVAIEWEYAPTVRRSHGWVMSLGPALGLTPEDLDGLFVLAATL